MVSLPGNVLSVASIVSLTLLDACVAFWCSECREQSRRLKSTQLYAPNTLWQFSQITHSQAFYSRLQLIRWLVDRVTLPGFLPDMWTLEHTMVQPSAFDKKVVAMIIRCCLQIQVASDFLGARAATKLIAYMDKDIGLCVHTLTVVPLEKVQKIQYFIKTQDQYA